MQFKNPTILYFLFLLLIPILVHLFQLQKFRKVAFTNVAFLKKISAETRKSSQLKKWLILTCRLLFLAALILAFSQPYFSNSEYEKSSVENYIYIDNSISLHSKGKKGDLLKVFAQEIIEKKGFYSDNISLLTNDQFYKNRNKSELDFVLKNLSYTPKSKTLKEIMLQFEQIQINKTKNLNEVTLISDFQNFKLNEFTNVNTEFSLISAKPETLHNISIDSLWVAETLQSKIRLEALIRNQGKQQENISFSIYTNNNLSNKKTFSFAENEQKIIDFSIEKSAFILGEIRLDFPDTFLFDNQFFFTLDFRSKINVLSIGKNSNFLPRIFNKNEFNFTSFSQQNINYNLIPKQQLIILNELESFSSSLSNSLEKFINSGGKLVIIPGKNLDIVNYNSFFKQFISGQITNRINDTLSITKIDFNHPLFSDVFSKKVQNFEYPIVNTYFKNSFTGNNILSFENKKAFLSEHKTQNSKIYWFSSPLNIESSNFSRSPLIVPTFYNLAYSSASPSKPFYFSGNNFSVTVNKKISRDDVLRVRKNQDEFIPLQQSAQNHIMLTFSDAIKKSGFYAIVNKNDTVQQIAVNFHPKESNLDYLDAKAIANQFENITHFDSVADFFIATENKNSTQMYWKLFLTIAIVSLLLEILILKFFKT